MYCSVVYLVILYSAGWTDRLASLSAVKIDEDLSPSLERKKVATVRRHQSLIVTPTHAKESPPFEQIVKMLANKRATDGRPDDIKVRVKMNLIVLLSNALVNDTRSVSGRETCSTKSITSL